MEEKSILAYFRTPDEAERALRQLQSLQLIDSAIDRFDGYPGGGAGAFDNPYAGSADGLGEMTLNGDFDNPDAGILAATSVSASGMSSGGPENRVTGRDILLTAIVEARDYERALQIVREAGAL